MAAACNRVLPLELCTWLVSCLWSPAFGQKVPLMCCTAPQASRCEVERLEKLVGMVRASEWEMSVKQVRVNTSL